MKIFKYYLLFSLFSIFSPCLLWGDEGPCPEILLIYPQKIEVIKYEDFDSKPILPPLRSATRDDIWLITTDTDYKMIGADGKPIATYPRAGSKKPPLALQNGKFLITEGEQTVTLLNPAPAPANVQRHKQFILNDEKIEIVTEDCSGNIMMITKKIPKLETNTLDHENPVFGQRKIYRLKSHDLSAIGAARSMFDKNEFKEKGYNPLYLDKLRTRFHGITEDGKIIISTYVDIDFGKNRDRQGNIDFITDTTRLWVFDKDGSWKEDLPILNAPRLSPLRGYSHNAVIKSADIDTHMNLMITINDPYYPKNTYLSTYLRDTETGTYSYDSHFSRERAENGSADALLIGDKSKMIVGAAQKNDQTKITISSVRADLSDEITYETMLNGNPRGPLYESKDKNTLLLNTLFKDRPRIYFLDKDGRMKANHSFGEEFKKDDLILPPIEKDDRTFVFLFKSGKIRGIKLLNEYDTNPIDQHFTKGRCPIPTCNGKGPLEKQVEQNIQTIRNIQNKLEIQAKNR